MTAPGTGPAGPAAVPHRARGAAGGATAAGACQGPVRLEVRGLQGRIAGSGAVVVRDVSFAVRRGEVYGLVGESGSGKTTVALALLGHARRGLSITGGEVLLDGVDVLRLPARELRSVRGAKVAYVPQDPAAALNPALRIGAQLREALRVHSFSGEDAEARVTEVLQEASLAASPQMLRRYPHQLSGGQQQRVALAMAFACRPSLIVLDEPTTGLDVTTQRTVLDTIRGLCRAYGVAAVYVSHDLAVVSELVSGVAVMYAGEIVEAGPAATVFTEPVHPYTRGLLAAVPVPDRAAQLAGIEGQQPRPGSRGPGCAFAPRCGLAVAECATRAPAPEAVAGRSVRCLRARQITATPLRRPAVAAGRDAPPGAPVLSARQVSASYGHTPVLSGVDIDVAARACVAVVGESGSGKTTLARCLTGLHSAWSGEISFQGSRLAAGTRGRPREVLRRMQYIFQNPYTSLNPRKTIGQIVTQPIQHFLGLPAGEAAERAGQVLAAVSLGADCLPRYPDQLSGGERQRVAIARALAVEPDLLICDEITSALDVSVQATIVELLRSIQRERHLAMIFITHNLALVRSIAQTCVVLRHGRVVEAGPVEQILDHPASPYTAQLMADVARMAAGH